MTEPVYLIRATASQLSALRTCVSKGASLDRKKPVNMHTLGLLLDQVRSDGPVPDKRGEVHPVFTLDCFNRDHMTDEDVAEALEFVASQVNEGYTSGDANGLGWWSVTNLTDAADMPRDDDDEPDDADDD